MADHVRSGGVEAKSTLWDTLQAQGRRLLVKRAARATRRRDALSRSRLVAETLGDLGVFLEAGERLSFPKASGAADISAVVVVWNQPHFLLRCLRALKAQTGPSIEVVLVDNGSSAPTQQLLSRLDGVTLVRNAGNEGFVTACNQGAADATGRTLLFLNSDAFVRAGALAAALGALDNNPDAGAVGGRLVLPSGRLQEAGCAIWSDGTTTGLGRGLASDAAMAARTRDVDYCSGAFLLTPRAVWSRLGGFEAAFSPGYYEDADYCMRLRETGLRAIFEPSAVVDHVENGSEAQLGAALKVSERNRAVFVARHAATLGARHAARPATGGTPS